MVSKLSETNLGIAGSAKYLGLILDRKLSWLLSSEEMMGNIVHCPLYLQRSDRPEMSLVTQNIAFLLYHSC